MDTSANKSDAAPATKAKKRGPYKQYAYHGSVSKVPATTRRDWDAKRMALSRQTGTGSSTTVTAPQFEEKASADMENAIGHPAMETNDEDDTATSDQDGNELSRTKPTSAAGSVTLQDSGSDFNPVTAISEAATKYTNEDLIATLLISATKLRHNLTYCASEDIVKLLRVMNGTHLTEGTKYHWKKVISDFSPSPTIHYICKKCQLYIGKKSEIRSQCQNCGDIVDPKNEDLKSNNAFLYIPLAYQLKQIFELTTAHNTCRKKPQKQCVCAIEDIFDGELYKRSYRSDTISINFSVDAFPVFDSSNYSSYPILCTINELNPRERKNHVLLCGLWFGKGKLNMNEYLKPFVAEAQVLYHDGFTYEYEGRSYVKKCRVLAGICDSVARPMLRNSTQFNGMYGCGLCLHPGEVVTKGRGTTRVYPLGADNYPFGEGLRTHDQTLNHAEEGVKGIKGRAVLCDIPTFDIISSLQVDWMHCVALGVCRQFAKLWFDPCNHAEKFYFGHVIKEIDELLLSYRPINEVSRTPRKMSDRLHWKAHEWVIFLLFYSLPSLLAFFPTKYTNHWSLLVDGIQILTKTSIMRSEIVFAQRSLVQFISGVEQLYGKQHISFNVHLLAHLGQSVETLGPLWTHSAFRYENTNQTLLSYIKSSNGVAVQICDAIRTKCVVNSLNYVCSDIMTNAQRAYLNNVLNKSVTQKPSLVLEGGCMIGTATIHEELHRLHRLAFVKANLRFDPQTTVESYKRALVNGEIVHSKAYTHAEKRCNYYVQLINGEIFEIELFFVLSIDHSVCCHALGKYFLKLNKQLIKDRRMEHLILLKTRDDDSLSLVNITMIKQKVMVLHLKHVQLSIACVRPNNFELLT